MGTRSHLKKKILVQDQGGSELQPAGILKYVEDLKRGPNAEIGPKDFFEIASKPLQQTVPKNTIGSYGLQGTRQQEFGLRRAQPSRSWNAKNKKSCRAYTYDIVCLLPVCSGRGAIL